LVRNVCEPNVRLPDKNTTTGCVELKKPGFSGDRNEKEMELLRAAARAGSEISTPAPSKIGEMVTPGARYIDETLTDRALTAHGNKTMREMNGSPAPSSIERVTSDKPDSLTFSPSLSRSVGEVECVQFKKTGRRWSTDVAKCDCHAYDRDNEDREYWRAIRLRKQMEENILDVDKWGGRIGRLDEFTEHKSLIEAQIRWKDEEDAQRILDDNQIEAFQTADDDDYEGEDEDEVQ
jgi:hypothetical protein